LAIFSFLPFGAKDPLFTASLLDRVSLAGLNIRVLNLYNPKSLVSTFLCDILKARHSCSKSMQENDSNNKKEKIANASAAIQVICDAIAMEAALQGLIDMDRFTRWDVVKRVMEHWHHRNITTADLPLICPNQQALEHLWSETLRYEARVFSNLTDTREAQLRADFQTYIDRKTYCHPVVARIVEDSEWRTFFSQFAKIETNSMLL